jgi:hypothetical protein
MQTQDFLETFSNIKQKKTWKSNFGKCTELLKTVYTADETPNPTSPLGSGGGLAVVQSNQPLSLPSPRASDPADLDHSRANIVFANPYDLPSESLQKYKAVEPDPLDFLFFLTPVGRFVAFTENDKTHFFIFFNFFNPAACRALAPLKKPCK